MRTGVKLRVKEEIILKYMILWIGFQYDVIFEFDALFIYKIFHS